MISGVYVALSGAKLQELRLEITANNLANANTAGYKADKVSSKPFDFELASAMGEIDDVPMGAVSEENPYFISYTKTNLVGTSFAQGPFQQTGNPLNIAVEGPGFISIDTPGGVRYTKQGSFQLDKDGNLLTPDGFKVRGKGLNDLGSGDITIDYKGNVLVDGMDHGSIEIVEFDDPNSLQKEGHSLFKAESLTTKKPDKTSVQQGSLEMSNINTVTEMVNLIELNRIFQSYQKAITSIDESTERLINGVAV